MRSRLALRVCAGIALALLAAGAIAPVLLSGPQQFTDIVAGDIAFAGYNKSGDFRLAWVFLLLAFVFYAALGTVRALRIGPKQTEVSGRGQILTAAAPVIVVALMTSRWFLSEARSSEFALAAGLVAAAALVLAVSVYRIVGPPRERIRSVAERVTLATLTAAFAFVSFLGLAATFSLVSLAPGPRSFVETNADTIMRAFLLAGTAIAMGAAAGTIRRDRLAHWCLAAQVLSPLVLVLPFIGVHEVGGRLFRSGVTDHARLLAAITVGVAIVSTFRAARRRSSEADLPFWRVILPWAVVAMAALAVFATPAASAFEMDDDFHTGETLIQWPQLAALGHQAFVSYFPIPGLLGAAIGWVNEVLFTGTATSYPQANLLLNVAAAGLTAALLVRLLGAHWALLLSTTLLLPANRTYLLLPVLAILALPALLQRPLLWLAAWTALAAIGTFFVSATGLAVTLGTAPVAIWVLWAWLRRARRGWSIRSEILRAIPLLVVVAAILAFLPNVLGLIEYLREGERSNVTAYGVGLFQSRFVPGLPHWIPFAVRKTVWEGVRLGAWVVAVPFLLGLLHAAVRKGRGVTPGDGPTPFAAFGLGLMGTLLASIPYALGRIDAGVLSRPGQLSLLTFAALLPAALLLYRRPRETLTGILISLTLALPLWGVFIPRRPVDLVRAAVAPIRATKPAAFFEESPERFPYLGRGLINRKHLERMQTLDGVLRAVARPGETYFDATNRSTYYYGLGRKVPAAFSGQFYAADETFQQEILRVLTREPPPVIWVAPRLELRFSLRSYRVYKWAMLEGYLYFRVADLDLLVHPERASAMNQVEATEVPNPAAWTPLGPGDLHLIPISWGRSFDSLAKRFGRPLHLRPAPAAAGPNAAAWVVPPGTPGSQYDFLLMEVSCSSGKDALVRTQIKWDVSGWARKVPMRAAPGRLLVPLGADPAWLLEEPKRNLLRIEAFRSQECGRLRFGPASLLPLEA